MSFVAAENISSQSSNKDCQTLNGEKIRTEKGETIPEGLRHFFFACLYRSAHFAQQKTYSLPSITAR
jgi:hypothetical protein